MTLPPLQGTGHSHPNYMYTHSQRVEQTNTVSCMYLFPIPTPVGCKANEPNNSMYAHTHMYTHHKCALKSCVGLRLTCTMNENWPCTGTYILTMSCKLEAQHVHKQHTCKHTCTLCGPVECVGEGLAISLGRRSHRLWILNLEAMTLEVTSASCQDWSSVLTHLCDITPSGGGAGSLGVPHHLTLIIPAGHLDPRLGVERVVPLHGVQIGTRWSRVCGDAFHSILGQVCIRVRGQPLGVGQPSLLGGRWPNFALSCCYTCVPAGKV